MAVMPPPGFKYMKAYLAGRPKHTPFDSFYYHHPPMDRRKRSKIFAPFEALEGYSESIDGVNADYMEHIELCETNKSEPGRRLTILSSPASNEKPALHNHVEESFDFDFQDIEWCEEDRLVD